MSSTLSAVALRGAGLVYGLASLSFLGFWAVWEGYLFRRPSAAFRRQVAAARDTYWDVSLKQDGFSHAFHTLENGCKLHYMTNKPTASPNIRNLVVFLHGWPDSWMLWRQTWTAMSAEARSSSALVAVDLPGFGGSDGLDAYGPDDVLEAVAEFIMAMRDKHDAVAASDGRVVLVAHDWGALIGFRLAADAPQLADRFILSNASIGPLVRDNISRRIAVTRRLLATWLRQPRKTSLLRSAYTSLAPVLAQLKSSTYVAIYNLPLPLPALFGALGANWFLRFATSLAVGAVGSTTNSPAAAVHLASSLGPSAQALRTVTTQNETYGARTHARARQPGGSFTESVRVYREGLATKPWSKSLRLLAGLHELEGGRRRASSGQGLIEDGPKGACRAPTTVVWGAGDPALQQPLMLEGVADYLPSGSGTVVLKGVGHWVPSDGKGPGVLARTVGWAVGVGQGKDERGRDSMKGLRDVLGGEDGVLVSVMR